MFFVYFLRSFVAQPSILIGLFVVLGNVIQRKSFSETIKSLFKTILGFIILGVGAGAIAGSLNNFFSPTFTNLFDLNGMIPNNDALAGQIFKDLPNIGQLASIIMVVSLLINVLFAATTRHKYIYLSGHVLFYMSVMLATVFNYSGMDFANNTGDYLISLFAGSVILGMYMVLVPRLAQKSTKLVTGTDNLAIGHTGNISYALAGFMGGIVQKLHKGKKVVFSDEIKFSDKLKVFRSTQVSMVVTMLLLYFSIMIPAGIMYELNNEAHSWFAEAFNTQNGQNNWIVTIIIQAFTFVAGAEIIIFGVRMFIGELIPSFRGISQKLIKNSRPAVDCAVFFSYSPNSVLIGFISSFIGGVLGLGFSILLNLQFSYLAVIIPGIVPHFFLGATAGVFGNARGGVWGATVGGFVNGLVITFVPIIFMAGGWGAINPETNKPMALGWGDTDYLLGVIPGLFGMISKWAILTLAIALPFVLYLETFIIKRYFPKKYKEDIKLSNE